MTACDIDWAALATMATGLLAVGGATWVGLRQTAILQQQANLEKTRLRVELYDRRLIVFESIRAYLDGILEYHGTPPPDLQAEAHVALARSRFLFGDDMQTWLDPIAGGAALMHTGYGEQIPEGSKPEDHAYTYGKQIIDAKRAELIDKFRPYLGLAAVSDDPIETPLS